MALGIIVPSPWKKPRSTPSTATTTRAGANTLRAKILFGVLSILAVKNSAPKYTIRATIVPDTRAKISAPFKI